MSVINRMLSDLERRGAPAELHSDPAMMADQRRPPGRLRTRVARAFPAVLAVILLAIATVLWLDRGPRLLAALTASGSPAVTAAAPAVPALIGIAFEGEAARPRLVLQFDRPPGRAPRYTRSGGHAVLSLDARLDEPSLPAPPAMQQVFRGLTLDPATDGRTRLQLDLAPAATLELRASGDRVVLEGRPAKTTAAGDARESAAAAEADDTREAAAAATAPGGEDADRTRVADAAERSEPAPAPREQTSEQAERSSKAAAGERSVNGDRADGRGSQSVRKSQSTSPEMRARRRYRDGRRALEDGKLSEARRQLGVALELDPGLHAARDLLVSLARRAGETDTARALLIEGAERAPERVKYAMPLARLLVDVGELDRAAGVLARARAAGTGNAGYHALTAAVAQRRGRHEQAAREYTRALEVDAGNGLWWLGLGVSLAASGHPEEARAALREARASGDLSARLDRWAQGRIDELSGGREG